MANSVSSRTGSSFPAGVQVFTGMDVGYTVLEFLSSVHANVRALPGPPHAHHISNHLRGRALLWFSAKHSEDSYDGLQSALLQSFSVDWSGEVSSERQFRLLQQGFGTVDQYAAEFEHLAGSCSENVNAEYNLRWFAWGLRHEVRELVFTEPYAFCSFNRLVAVAEDAAVYLHLESRARPRVREGTASRLSRRYRESLRKAKEIFFILRRSPDPSRMPQSGDTVSFSFQSISEADLAKTPTPSPRTPPSTRARLRSFTSHPEIVSDFGQMGARRTPDVPIDASPGGSNGSSASPIKSSPDKSSPTKSLRSSHNP